MMFADVCTDMGYHPFPQPAGITSRAYHDPLGNYHSECIYCGFCTRFGCEVDAKTSAVNTHIPAALRTGNYSVRNFSKVMGVNIGADGLATGLTYLDLLSGEEHFQPADVVLLTGYTLTNVRMLLLSRNNAHPNGIGNDHGMVGRNYTYQLSQGPATGIFEGRRFNLFMGNGVVQNLIYEFNADNFDHSGLGFIGGASIYCGSGQRDPLTTALDMPSLRAGTPEAPPSGHLSTSGEIPTSADVGSLAHRGKEWGQDLEGESAQELGRRGGARDSGRDPGLR